MTDVRPAHRREAGQHWQSGLRRVIQAATVAACLSMSSSSNAFPHVVQEDETLAEIADRYYGRIQMERVLATANALTTAEGTRGAPVTPGMLLEVPSLTYHRVEAGQTWEQIAHHQLGHEDRSIVLAQVNGHKPWEQPETGQMIRIPYNLAWRASGEESLATLAYRFLGSTKHAYRIVQYNGLDADGPQRGQLLLLPLSDLHLTEEGRRAARRAAGRLTRQAQGLEFERQQASAQELMDLSRDVRGGRYVSAVARGSALLEGGQLSQQQRASVQRWLLESYVALGVTGRARSACQQFRELSDEQLDAIMTSPKILELCPNPQPDETRATDQNDGPGDEEENQDEPG